MSGYAPSTRPTLERLAVVLVPLVVLVAGFLWFVQPRIAAALKARNDLQPAESRLAVLEGTVARGGTASPAGGAEWIAEFERRVPTEDRVPELIEILAREALDPPDPTEARALLIEAGQRVRPADAALSGAPRVLGSTVAAEGSAIDPRFALFPAKIEYTPVTVSFETTYDRLGRFVWRLRDLPTAVEVRSLEVTRALPLLKVKLVLFAFQRSGAAASPPAPSAPAPARVPASSVADRGAREAGSEERAARVNGVTP